MKEQESKYVLEAEELHKSFYQPAEVSILRGVSLKVHRGETVAIMGASGEGKSTLLHVLGTLEPPCKGKLTIAGQHVTAFNRSVLRRNNIGFVFQSFHLMEDYTVLDNVLMPARIARANIRKGSVSYARAIDMLERVGLGERLDFNTKLLSGGEKQRVSLARALCNDPDLILADEPSGNLDHSNSQRIHELLISVAHDENRGVIIVTHDQELADLCDTRYQLRGGLLQPEACSATQH